MTCRNLSPVLVTKVKDKLLSGPEGPKDNGLDLKRYKVMEPEQEDIDSSNEEAAETTDGDGDLGIEGKDLRKLKLEDETLKAVRVSTMQPSKAGNYWFYEEDGLLYHHWHP